MKSLSLHAHTHAYTYTCIHIHMHTCTHTFTHTPNTHTYTCTHVHTTSQRNRSSARKPGRKKPSWRGSSDCLRDASSSWQGRSPGRPLHLSSGALEGWYHGRQRMPLGPPTLRPTRQSLTKWWTDLCRHTTSCLGEVAATPTSPSVGRRLL